MTKKLALAGVSLVLSLLLAEVALRALGYYGVRGADIEKLQLVDDPVVDYRRVPGLSWIENNLRYDINSRGWRDREHTFEKPATTYRILSVGDSVTNGHGVNVGDIYTKQLETFLGQNPPRKLDFEVVLVTQGALNTQQEVHLVEVEGLDYDPDLIVVGYVLNDPAEGASLGRDRQRATERSALARLKGLGERSSIVHLSYRTIQQLGWLARRTLGQAEVAGYATDDYFARLHRQPHSWQRVTEAFDRLAQLTAERQLPVLLVIFPVFYELETYAWADVHAQVAEAAASRGFLVLDLLETYRGHDPNDLQVVEGDHVHPNPLGHRLAAEAIDRFLRETLWPTEPL